MVCPGVESGFCYNGGVCVNGTTCLCGHRSEWSGADCSESKIFKIICCLLRSSYSCFIEQCSGNYKCLNGGSCGKHASKHKCMCTTAYEGELCEKLVEH